MGDPAEQVLVVERGVFDRVGAFQGVVFDVERYLSRLLAAGIPRYMLRSAAETNPGLKQLIPYVIMTCEGKVLSYVRGSRAGETRLVGRRSIGIGGHINPPDELPLFDSDFRDAYLAAVAREVGEEVTIQGEHVDRVAGLLNDDSNEVGRVHLGIVHHWDLQLPKVTKREQMMTQMTFMSVDELRADRESLETWSQHCLDHIEALTGLGVAVRV